MIFSFVLLVAQILFCIAFFFIHILFFRLLISYAYYRLKGNLHFANTTEHDIHCIFPVVYLIMYAFFRRILFFTFFRLYLSFSARTINLIYAVFQLFMHTHTHTRCNVTVDEIHGKELIQTENQNIVHVLIPYNEKVLDKKKC